MIKEYCDLCNREITEGDGPFLMTISKEDKPAMPERNICVWCKETLIKMINLWRSNGVET